MATTIRGILQAPQVPLSGDPVGVVFQKAPSSHLVVEIPGVHATLPTASSSASSSSILSPSTPSILSSETVESPTTSESGSTTEKPREYDLKKQQGVNKNVVSTNPRTINNNVKHVDNSSSSSTASSSSTSLPTLPSIPSSSSSSSNNSAHSDAGITQPRRPSQRIHIQFAPLPEMAPRKRKSSTPLGMAARRDLVRRRRAWQAYEEEEYYDGGYDSYRRMEYSTLIAEEAEKAERKREKIRRKIQLEMEEEARNEAAEGEVLKESEWRKDLAKKVGWAGKQLWKKVAQKELHKEAIGETGEVDEEKKTHSRLALATVVQKVEEQQKAAKKKIEEVVNKIQESRSKESLEKSARSPDAPPSSPSTPPIPSTPAGALDKNTIHRRPTTTTPVPVSA